MLLCNEVCVCVCVCVGGGGGGGGLQNFQKTTLFYFQPFQIYEVEQHSWQPYLSLFLQNLSPFPGRLNFKSKT